MSNPLFSAAVLTLFPEMFPGPLGQSLAGKALSAGIWKLNILNIRDFATDKHATVDDSPFGGGIGMVMKPDVLDSALSAAKASLPGPARLIYPSPRGVPFEQKHAEEFKNQNIVILCGRFEGIDQRIIDHHQLEEISLGDFVLSGGEIAAFAMLDATVRLLPGVISKPGATVQESFGYGSKYAGLLEYPHYTRPSVWNGIRVPDVLLSGNHEQIEAWRLEQAQEITASRRPDLWNKREKKDD